MVLFVLMPIAASADTVERDAEIAQIEADAEKMFGDIHLPYSFEELCNLFEVVRNSANEELALELLETIYADDKVHFDDVDSHYPTMSFFVSYGVPSAGDELGAGERAGSIDSWREAKKVYANGVFLPYNTGDWGDILKIANGRWPTYIVHDEVEEAVYDEFEQIYKRQPNRENINDDAAVMIMAYGLRPSIRNLDSENIAIGYYKSIFSSDPNTSMEWNIVRAIAYSGAIR